MTVYKYMSADVASLFLRNWSVAFRAPAHFNDPFDSFPGLFTRTEEARSVRVDALTEQHLGRFDLNLESARRYADYQSKWEERDYKESVRRQIVHDYFLVTCFTRTRNHPLMWSHYAGGHTGVLVGFREDCELLRDRLTPVVYSDERPALSLFGADGNISPGHLDTAKRLSFFKGLEWAYEQESRVVLRSVEFEKITIAVDQKNPDDPRLAKIHKSDVEIIVFGSRFDFHAFKGAVNSLFNDEATKHIDFFRAVPDEREFKQNYIPLENARKQA